ncbi:TonB-dependent receptor [Mucilaginibacter sp. MD40]|uniref:TonB-dependent receptor domain-containing protein n=1 Tax=Mucilaginibacter sp. MD40 TaxID=2029590 RepID=UPI000BACB8F2|nr:TonB-dependent receptor [Mucilaginibacter sp. MD40]PAW92320.1 TonB-dependent receptor [Mucilaginibacter sp. MD40]
MFLRFTTLPIFILLFTIAASAQTTGSITGTVRLVNGDPFASASVSIIETGKGTLTDEQGNYTFLNITAGVYHLKIQVLGAPEKILQVKVADGQTSRGDYQLPKENVQALQEVSINSSRNRFAKKESPYVARLPLKNLENPQVYNTVSKAMIEEQSIIDLGSVGKDIPGAGIPTVANQGRVTFHSRGFEVEPNARNGVAGTAFSIIDPANLERVEAIKGPSATLFGNSVSSSYGGLINRVTKKPYNGFGGEVAYYGGSFNMNRLTVDLNTPVNADKTALFRMSGATTYQKSFQDLGFSNTLSLAPSFSYQINDRLSMLVDVEYGQAKATSVVRFNPYNSSGKNWSITDIGFPYKRTFLSNDLPYQTQMVNFFAQLNYKLSGNWTSQTVISRARSNISGYITALNGLAGDTTVRPNIIAGVTSFTATDLQQNFTGDFKIGNLRNRMVIGLDYFNNYNDFDRVTVSAPAVNFLNPPATYRITRNQVDVLTNTGTLRKEINKDNTYSAYVSDVLNLTDRFNAMLSLRIDRYQYKGNYNINTGVTGGGLGTSGQQAGPFGQTALAPKLGLVYEVLKDQLSLFGNYMNGFFNHSGAAKDGSIFKPEHGNQLEFGLKGDLLDHKIVGTVSVYDIRVDNTLRTDPTDANYQVQDGSQRSKGIEVDLVANPFAGLNLVAGYAYNDIKYTKGDPLFIGYRPALSGPGRTLNFWASYRLPDGKWKGLGAGFGGNYGSSAIQTLNRATVGTGATASVRTTTVTIPSYTMLDASLFYDQPKYRLSLKVDNLTSEKAWSERLTPQAPATFIGSIALKF